MINRKIIVGKIRVNQRFFQCFLLVLFFLLIAIGSPSHIVCAQSGTLLQKTDLVYQGAFRVPQGTYGTSTLNWGGTAIAYNAANNSLYITSHDHDQHIGEMSIPALVNSSNINDLNTATFIQNFKDGLEGRLNSVNPSDPNKKIIGGLLVYNNELYIAVWSYYDGAGTQYASHFVRPLNLSNTGNLEGPYTVGTQYPGWVSGYMGAIPPEWQGALGGPALTGGCCHAIVSQQSLGPAVSIFDPTDVGRTSPVGVTAALGYPNSNPTLGAWNCGGTPNPAYNMTTQVGGVVFPTGTASVLFFGMTGLGACYYQAGVHAPPYSAYAWAYDVNDLIAVKNGEINQWDITPYDTWEIDFYFGGSRISGAAYDPVNQLIYVAEFCTDGECYPVIHAFLVNSASPSSNPQPPRNLRME